MSQQEALIVADVKTEFTSKQILISTTSKKRREAVERIMVIEVLQ